MAQKSVLVQVFNRKTRFYPPYPKTALGEFFSFFPNNYKFMPAYRMGYWDGRIRMLKRDAMPTGLFLAMKDQFLEEHPKFKFEIEKEIRHIKFNKSGLVSDREYQNECVQNMILASVDAGGGLVLGATGTGKTFMSAMYFSRLKGRAIFIVDQLDLLEQAREEIATHLNEKVGKVGESIFRPRRITVATIQTLHKHRKKYEFKKWTRGIDVIMIDEIHVAMNRSNFQTVAKINPPVVFGLTATLELKKKPVRMRAFSLCGPVCYEYPLERGRREGFLSKGCVLSILHENRDDGEGRDYHTLYKDLIVRDEDRNLIIESLTREGIRRGKYIIVLVERLAHLRWLSETFENIRHQVVCGEVEVEQRMMAKKKFEKGEIHLILANKVFKKGVNIKRVDVIIDAAGLKSKNDAVQKYGRGVRMCKGKDGLIYFDVSDVGNRFEKAAKSRRRAFKDKQIPVKRITWAQNPKKMYNTAEEILRGIK